MEKKEHHGGYNSVFLNHLTALGFFPMVPISKTNGSLHLCIDYCKLNQVTVGDPYQIPSVDDLLDRVAEATWFFFITRGSIFA